MGQRTGCPRSPERNGQARPLSGFVAGVSDRREGSAEAEDCRGKSCLADNLSLLCLALRNRSLSSSSQIPLAPFRARFVPLDAPKTPHLPASKKRCALFSTTFWLCSPYFRVLSRFPGFPPVVHWGVENQGQHEPGHGRCHSLGSGTPRQSQPAQVLQRIRNEFASIDRMRDWTGPAVV